MKLMVGLEVHKTKGGTLMAHNQLDTASHLGHSNTTAVTIIALGLVSMIAVACGIAFSVHAEHASQAETPSQTTSASNIKTPINQEKVHTMQSEPGTSSNATSPSVTNTSTSSTTVTVNGRTETMHGDGSLDKSYISSDGHTNVHIAINHSSTSTEDGNSQ